MSPWAIWMIRHRLAWLLKVLAFAMYPLHVLSYCGDALRDVRSTIREINYQQTKGASL